MHLEKRDKKVRKLYSITDTETRAWTCWIIAKLVSMSNFVSKTQNSLQS